MSCFTRRSFVGGVVAATVTGAVTTIREEARAESHKISQGRASTFCDILRIPDRVIAYGETERAIVLTHSQSKWRASGIEVETVPESGRLAIHIAATTTPLTRVHLRWNLIVNPSILILGDAWERSYGELAWRSFVPERAMPWYFVTHAQDGTHGYGVLIGAGALCFWQIDRRGISLWLDVMNGGMGVVLGERVLHAATVVSRKGEAAELPLGAVTDLCRRMSPHPRLPKGPIYGTNDWYYAYGKNTAEQILRDTDLVASLSPTTGHRPFSVIDAGWGGNSAFPNMAQLAEEIRKRGVRPGIWIRPTEAPMSAKPAMLLPGARFGSRSSRAAELAYDPTIPEALEAVLSKIAEVVEWKYELIKHDFSTYDLLGQWGFEMGATPTNPGWHFNYRGKTNAEIIFDLYSAMRKTAGDSSILLGCNTVGHLSAGLFELQRTGDDTSGQHWERTRRMGVNTLAYRLPQHGTFFVQDADCVAITKAIAWGFTRDWLDVVARSGTALLLSPSPDAVGEEQRTAIREAFAIAASGEAMGRPLNWFEETAPENWVSESGSTKKLALPRHYNWSGEDGCSPFVA